MYACEQSLEGNIPKVKLFIMVVAGSGHDLFFTFETSLIVLSVVGKSFTIIMLIVNTLFETRSSYHQAL